LPLPESDAGLVAALQAGRDDAREEIVRRCGPDVARVLYRILGPDPELEDVAHDVFLATLASLHRLRHPHALRSFIVSIAVRKVKKLIRSRTRWRRVMSIASGELPEREAPQASAEVSEALRSTYRIFNQLDVDDRVAFALRNVEGMDLRAIAEVTEVSLATVKRRIARAERRFAELARKNDVLAPWVEQKELES
jgi:RNA polymerase sigma-70 factor (ECF subfamily)